MLQEMQSLEALADFIEAARREIAGAESGSQPAGGMEAQKLAQLLQRLGKRGGGGMGQDGSPAAGGAAGRAPDDGQPEVAERVRGQLDPRGRLGPKKSFRGLPRPEDSRLGFDEAIRQAAAAAEESIGRDEVPPSARPAVRRWFEALRESR